MGGIQWLLELGLIGLLAATLFHAVRLERALGVLKRDRAALQGLVQEFNASTQQAEAGVERLRGAVDGAGRQIARQIEGASALKDDLVFLSERGERLADRLDQLVRAGRPMEALPRNITALPRPTPKIAVQSRNADDEDAETPRVRSQAERDLMQALRLSR